MENDWSKNGKGDKNIKRMTNEYHVNDDPFWSQTIGLLISLDSVRQYIPHQWLQRNSKLIHHNRDGQALIGILWVKEWIPDARRVAEDLLKHDPYPLARAMADFASNNFIENAELFGGQNTPIVDDYRTSIKDAAGI